MRVIRLFVVFVFVAAMLPGLPAGAQTMRIAWQAASLPVTVGGRPYALQAMLLYPQDGARHPLVIVSHGSPRSANDRPGMLPTQFADEMLWFVRRGLTVAAVLRRGYGASQGPWGESYGTCSHPDYTAAGLAGAADIAASITALASNPHVDASRVLAVGVSAGAFASVALTAHPPSALAGAIAFAPGRGSTSADQVCDQDALIAAFRQYGQTSRVPVLWISAANDHFFGPGLVKASLAAFNGAGGKATFFAAPPAGSDGHGLFGMTSGIAIWQSPVQAFLAQQHFGLSEPADIAGPAVAAPAALGPKGRGAFAQYLIDAPHKAFALAPDGRYAYAVGTATDAAASQRATRVCGQADCHVVNVDGVAAK